MIPPRLLRYRFLLPVLNHCLLRDGLAHAHAAAHAAETARLEGCLEVAAAATAEAASLGHHGHASEPTAAETTAKEVVIVIEGAAEAATHAHAGEGIPLLNTTLLPGAAAHASAHTSAHASEGVTEATTEEIVVVVEEVGEGVLASEEVPKYLISTRHIKSSRVEVVVPEASSSEACSSAAST